MQPIWQRRCGEVSITSYLLCAATHWSPILFAASAVCKQTLVLDHSSRQASTDALCCRLVIEDEKDASEVQEGSGSHGLTSSCGKGEAIEAVQEPAEAQSGVEFFGEEATGTQQTNLVDNDERRWLLDHGGRADTSPALPRYPVPREGNALTSGESAAEAPANFLPGHHSQEEVSAIRIQAAVRGRLARKHAAAVKQEGHSLSASAVGKPLEKAAEEASAIKIQAAVRGRLARKSAAALKQPDTGVPANKGGGPFPATASMVGVQAAVRGMSARKSVAAVKQGQDHSLNPAAVEEHVEDVLEAASAVKIQAAVRGRLARKLAAGMKQPHPELAPEAAVNHAAEEASAIRIQAAFRGKLARKSAAAMMQHNATEEASAIRIQAAFRGQLARKSAAAMMQHNASVCNDYAEQASAVKIQALVRGRIARKSMAALRTATAVAEQPLQTSLRRTSTGECTISCAVKGCHLSAMSWRLL